MLPKIAPFIFALGLAAAAGAQMKVSLSFPSSGPYRVWTSPPGASSIPADAEIVRSKETVLPFALIGMRDSMYVLDESTWNLARKSMRDVEGAWDLKAADFNLIGQVKIRVESRGEPIAAATVTLEGSTGTQTQIIDPGSNGEATFLAVTPGEIKIGVQYRSADQTVGPERVIYEAPLERDKLIPTFVYSVSEPAETVRAGSGQPESEAQDSDRSGPGNAATNQGGANPFGKFIINLLGLAIGVAIIYGIYKFVKSRPEDVAAQIKKLGISVPDPNADQGGDPGPVTAPVMKPEPPKPILLDDAAPTPIGASPMGAPAAPGAPRLSSNTGLQISLQDGSTVVGREPGLGVSLPGENGVSRRHAEFRRTATGISVMDLGSTNGTYVNGVRIQGETALKVGDTVQFGTVQFRVESL